MGGGDLFMNKVFIYLLVFMAISLPAYAVVILPSLAAYVAQVEIMAGVILTALATIWVIRKLIKMVNKS
jgi:hypothetical protein